MTSLRQDPPGWNPAGPNQLCNCGHEKDIHGNGEFWTSCQTADDCDCSKFIAASQSPEARAQFRREMDAGLRCRMCGSGFHNDEYHNRPVYGGPVCNYPECGHEPSLWDVLRRDLGRLYRRVLKK